jgi:toxin ParE1/3/4
MATLNWTVEAESWLEDIYAYIAQDSPNAATEVINGIYQRSQVLREFPLIGYKYEVHQNRDIRILLYGHYRIAYLLKDSERIDVLGVFHGAMEIERHLKHLNA